MTQANLTQVKETELFFRQWLRSPKSMGSIIPSSRALARAIAAQVAWQPGQVVVELGAGTGAISQALTDSGLPLAFQRAIVDQGLAAIAPGGCMLQYSYSPIAPIPAKKLGVDVKLVKFVLRNLPPATVWRYRRAAARVGS